jgi:hypothetical protein
MDLTVPVFILGSGRSGTFQMMKMFEGINDVDSNHEYLFETVLKPSVLHRMNLISYNEILTLINSTHVPAVHYSKNKIWIDSSNALPWIIKPLYELFPNAKFIHLVRDGRKVVSSFYNKFPNTVYDDDSVKILENWMKDPDLVTEPPFDKKYWRPLPVDGDKHHEDFKRFNRFQRICYYWRDVNLQIKKSLEVVPKEQKMFIQLENLVSDVECLKDFFSMTGVKFKKDFIDQLKRPVNVAVSKNFPLTKKQNKEFYAICNSSMELFGYKDKEEYEVIY